MSYTGRDSQRKLLRHSGAVAVVPGNNKPMKIAAINGKPKVNQRYLGLSRECEFYFYFY